MCRICRPLLETPPPSRAAGDGPGPPHHCTVLVAVVASEHVVSLRGSCFLPSFSCGFFRLLLRVFSSLGAESTLTKGLLNFVKSYWKIALCLWAALGRGLNGASGKVNLPRTCGCDLYVGAGSCRYSEAPDLQVRLSQFRQALTPPQVLRRRRRRCAAKATHRWGGDCWDVAQPQGSRRIAGHPRRWLGRGRGGTPISL